VAVCPVINQSCKTYSSLIFKVNQVFLLSCSSLKMLRTRAILGRPRKAYCLPPGRNQTIREMFGGYPPKRSSAQEPRYPAGLNDADDLIYVIVICSGVGNVDHAAALVGDARQMAVMVFKNFFFFFSFLMAFNTYFLKLLLTFRYFHFFYL